MQTVITSQAQTKLWNFIRLMKDEVGGFGSASFDQDNDVIVWDDLWLVPQYVSKGEVEFTEDGLILAVEKFGDRLDDPSFMPVSWHSHNTMKAFWSGTDEKCIKTYGGQGMTKLLSFVGCHDYDYKMRLDFFGVEHYGIAIPQVTMDEQELLLDNHDPLFAAILDELDENIKKRPAPAIKRNNAQFPKLPKPQQLQPKLDRAFELSQLMEEGLSYHDAKRELDEWGTWDNGYEIGESDFHTQALGGLV